MAAFIIFKRSGPLVCKMSKWMSPSWLYSLAIADGVWWGRVLVVALANSPTCGRRNQRHWCNHGQKWIRALGARAMTNALWGAAGHLANQSYQGHRWIRHRWASCKGKGRADAFAPGFGTHHLCLFSGNYWAQEGANGALAWVRHANTLRDLGWQPLLLWASVSSFLQIRKWYNDIRKTPSSSHTPGNTHSHCFLSPGENCHPKKKRRKFCSKEVFQILKKVWGVLGLLQHSFHLKWQISIIVQSGVSRSLPDNLWPLQMPNAERLSPQWLTVFSHHCWDISL